jgi:hypothetical protein
MLDHPQPVVHCLSFDPNINSGDIYSVRFTLHLSLKVSPLLPVFFAALLVMSLDTK